MRLITTALICLFAGSVLAETVITIPIEDRQVGTTFTYQFPSGATQKRRVKFNNGKRVEVEAFSTRNGERLRYTQVQNSQGLVKKIIYADGGWFEYKPHNCIRTIGDCSYEFTHSNGGVYRRKYHAVFLDGVLTAKVMNESDFVLEVHELTYDSDGTLSSYSAGKPGEVELVMKLVAVNRP